MGRVLALALAVLCYASASAQIELQGIDGRSHQPLAVGGAKATCYVFVLSECPIANKFAPEIQRLAEIKGTKVALVYVDRNLSREAAEKHAKAFGYKLPVLLDPDRKLAKALGVTVSPEAVVLDSKAKVAYSGRIDDRYPSMGVRREPRSHDLRDALIAVASGKTPSKARTKAVGCVLE